MEVVVKRIYCLALTLCLSLLFSTTFAAGKTIPSIHTDKKPAAITDAQVLDIVKKAYTTSYTYSYTDYSEVFRNAKTYFSKQGWDSFQKALNKSGNLKALVSLHMHTLAQVLDTPKPEVIKKEKDAWMTMMEGTIKYYNPKGTYTLNGQQQKFAKDMVHSMHVEIFAKVVSENNKLKVNQIIVRSIPLQAPQKKS